MSRRCAVVALLAKRFEEPSRSADPAVQLKQGARNWQGLAGDPVLRINGSNESVGQLSAPFNLGNFTFKQEGACLIGSAFDNRQNEHEPFKGSE